LARHIKELHALLPTPHPTLTHRVHIIKAPAARVTAPQNTCTNKKLASFANSTTHVVSD
jgi:hypothetical protein